MCYASNTGKLALVHRLMLVVVFDGVDVTLHEGGRGALERDAGGASGDTEVRNLTVGDIIHESCASGRLDERTRKATTEARTVDENRFEGTSCVVIRPLLMSSGTAAPLLF